MKSKSLLFTLFVLFWTMVYGVSFFGGSKLKTLFGGLIPTGYKMYAPPTTTNYDVAFTFFLNNEEVEHIRLSEYLKKENEKPFYHDKTAFVKERLFLHSIKDLDFAYQSALYDSLYKNKENDFEVQLLESESLKLVQKSFSNFAQLYLYENPDLNADQVKVEVHRYPIEIPWNLEYDRDFTYTAGEGIIYNDILNLN